ncbi:hypothetical protein [Corynebacterium striatum]|uniref:hypothetical protein n=1 Tax=Corynebacterium striatum TaxID=43770 RepID=UPI0027BB018D|nr:hypothetical protein [Corynebacterium striatum]
MPGFSLDKLQQLAGPAAAVVALIITLISSLVPGLGSSAPTETKGTVIFTVVDRVGLPMRCSYTSTWPEIQTKELKFTAENGTVGFDAPAGTTVDVTFDCPAGTATASATAPETGVAQKKVTVDGFALSSKNEGSSAA